MINFKITGVDSDILLTISRPAGKSLSLKAGELIKAEIMNIFPSGSISIRVKGTPLSAKTDVPLQKEGQAFFKVVDPSGGKDLQLKFIGYADTPQGTPLRAVPETITKLIQELAQMLQKNQNTPAAPQEKIAAQIETLLKSLPSEHIALPKELRVQLQALLHSSVKETGQSIQARIATLLEQLPDEVSGALRKDLLINIEQIRTQLKAALQDTGVVLEAKMKALTELVQHLERAAQGVKTPDRPEGAPSKSPMLHDLKQLIIQSGDSGIKGDLKAGLIQLQELLTEQGDELVGSRQGTLQSVSTKELSQQVNGLLRDIEMLQLLSKATDSFYTFLPLDWKDLREGEIAFKKGRSGGQGDAYSCQMNLDLEEFGKLSIMVTMYGGQFSVYFRAEDPEFGTLLTDSAKELGDNFRERGLLLKGVTVFEKDDSAFDMVDELHSAEKGISIKA